MSFLLLLSSSSSSWLSLSSTTFVSISTTSTTTSTCSNKKQLIRTIQVRCNSSYTNTKNTNHIRRIIGSKISELVVFFDESHQQPQSQQQQHHLYRTRQQQQQQQQRRKFHTTRSKNWIKPSSLASSSLSSSSSSSSSHTPPTATSLLSLSKNDKDNDTNDTTNNNNDDVVQTTIITTTTINQQPAPPNNWIDMYLPTSVRPYAKIARIDKPIGTMLLLWPCWWSTILASATPKTILPATATAAAAAGEVTTTTIASGTTTNGTDSVVLINNGDVVVHEVLSNTSTILSNVETIQVLGLFGMGAFIMRSAGCIINDLWDEQYDKQVARTATTRPLVTGEITKSQALLFVSTLFAAGLGVVVALPNVDTCFLWSLASVPLVIIYPTTKRYFLYPQFILGLTFNWGCFMGYASIHGSVLDYSNTILPLYGGAICWTLIYDTIYGHQDKNDDLKLGLQSTAINFGTTDQQQRMVLYTLAALTSMQWCYVGTTFLPPLIIPETVNLIDLITSNVNSIGYYTGMVGTTSHLLWQIRTANFNEPSNLAYRFRSNNTVGAIVFIAIVTGTYL